jgi:DNA-binding MarR family transcriptional regulator
VNDQMDLFGRSDEPHPDQAHARRTDPETSHEAAESVASETIRLTQRRILIVLYSMGSQDDIGIAQAISEQAPMPPSPSGLRTRRSELVAKGLVRHSGEYGKSASGRRTRLWEITEAGRRLLR